MAASAQAEPYDDCSTEDTAQYPTRPVYPTNPGNSSSGLITDACNIGYASENGGTTGGGSAAPMTITSLEELEACATKGSSVCLVRYVCLFPIIQTQTTISSSKKANFHEAVRLQAAKIS